MIPTFLSLVRGLAYALDQKNAHLCSVKKQARSDILCLSARDKREKAIRRAMLSAPSFSCSPLPSLEGSSIGLEARMFIHCSEKHHHRASNSRKLGNAIR